MPVGLHNQGNTCYMNSAIQFITNSRVIAKILQDNRAKGELLAAGAQLVDDETSKSVTTPSLIKSLMGQRHFLFAGFGQ